jgi:hypothetical protein
MKEICENIFCFWRKWCKKKDDSLVSIESTKMLENEKDKDNYSHIIHNQHIENTTFKLKEPEIEMSTALPIEEDNIFPLKYLNKVEADQNFKFDFTKEKIIAYIEEQINDNKNFTSLVNKNGFDIYIKESGSIFSSEFPMIKMFYKIPKSAFTKKDVTVKLIDDYMNNPEKRLKWDKTIRYYNIVERHNEEVYLLHYIIKSPMIFVSERDVVDKRYDFYEKDIYYDFSSSVNDDLVAIEEGVVRITNHCSVCKIYEEEDSFSIISITQVDSKFNVPPAMLSVQLPIKYKDWYDAMVNEINERN